MLPRRRRTARAEPVPFSDLARVAASAIADVGRTLIFFPCARSIVQDTRRPSRARTHFAGRTGQIMAPAKTWHELQCADFLFQPTRFPIYQPALGSRPARIRVS
jgi:hypothetical protein